MGLARVTQLDIVVEAGDDVVVAALLRDAVGIEVGHHRHEGCVHGDVGIRHGEDVAVVDIGISDVAVACAGGVFHERA